MIKNLLPIKPVQTYMAVDCDGICVHYFEDPDAFEYTFHVDGGANRLEAEFAVNRIVAAMIRQSYDHGAAWRTVGETKYTAPNECKYVHTFKVRFQIKDTY